VLDNKTKKQLKARANSLKPVFFIGKDGLSEQQLQHILQGFNHTDLIKVKLQESAPKDKNTFAAVIAEKLADVEVVQIIGNTIVLFRPLPEEEGKK
jgi:RNA-binding protein